MPLLSIYDGMPLRGILSIVCLVKAYCMKGILSYIDSKGILSYMTVCLLYESEAYCHIYEYAYIYDSMPFILVGIRVLVYLKAV